MYSNHYTGGLLMLTFQCEDTIIKMQQVLREHNEIAVAVSGGSDSDILIHLFHEYPNIHFVFFDTGLEWDASKRQLDYLENKYNIIIERVRPKEPIPVSIRKHGIPFKSKFDSEMLSRLQKHGFDFQDKPVNYDAATKVYPNALSALKYAYRENTNLNINMKLLSEFETNGIPFRISNKCCESAKKKPMKSWLREHPEVTCNVTGMRRAEGGVRSFRLSNCYADGGNGKVYHPLLHWTDEDKQAYESHFGIVHSDCYEKYGLERTGCVACPYGRDWEFELETAAQWEPNTYKAALKLFSPSYDLSRKWKDNNERNNK